MTPSFILQPSNFNLLAEAPGGVPELRELILQLAVRGKLVPQEGAGKRKIYHEEHEGKDGEEQIEGPYAVPPGWRWTTLAQAGKVNPRNKVDDDLEVGFAPMAVISDRYGVTPSYERRFWRDVKKGFTHFSEGDIGVAKITPCFENGKSAVFRNVPNGIGAGTTELHVFRPAPESVISNYVWIFLKSPGFRTGGESVMTGSAGQKRVPADYFAKTPFPLPPLAEQKRIVARVDELMKRCDELEARQKERDARHTVLVSSCLHALVAPARAAARPPSAKPSAALVDERPRDPHFILHPSSFNILFTSPDSVAQLRKTILQLAVQGRLVPQDPRDEPADELLGRIRAACEGPMRRGESPPTESISARLRSTNPYDLPRGWIWARFLELGEFGRGKSKHRPRNDPALYKGGRYPMVQTGDIARAAGFVTTHTALYNEVGLAQSRMWPAGTMCVTIAANIADTAILGFDACFPDSVVGFVPSPLIGDAQYFEYFMRTAQDKLADFAPSTAQKNINLGILNAVMIPLPPLNEMRRIVAKVNELMALCDALEAKLTQSRADADTIAAAVVQRLCSGSNPVMRMETTPA